MDFLLQNKLKKIYIYIYEPTCAVIMWPNCSQKDTCVTGVTFLSFFSSPLLLSVLFTVFARDFFSLIGSLMAPWICAPRASSIPGFHPGTSLCIRANSDECRWGEEGVSLLPFTVKFLCNCPLMPAAVKFYCICKIFMHVYWYRELQMWILGNFHDSMASLSITAQPKGSVSVLASCQCSIWLSWNTVCRVSLC